MPADHFAILRQPRRPWLDPAALKDDFHRLAAAHHPDVSGESEISADLNAAYAALRDPVSRLRCLLELEYPDAIAQQSRAQLLPALVERFMAVATLRREAEVFLHQQSAATSPLSQALLASERFAQKRDLEKQLVELEAAYTLGLDQLRAEDAAWDDRSADTGPRLAALHQQLAYFSNWMAQLREDVLRVSS